VAGALELGFMAVVGLLTSEGGLCFEKEEKKTKKNRPKEKRGPNKK